MKDYPNTQIKANLTLSAGGKMGLHIQKTVLQPLLTGWGISALNLCSLQQAESSIITTNAVISLKMFENLWLLLE